MASKKQSANSTIEQTAGSVNQVLGTALGASSGGTAVPVPIGFSPGYSNYYAFSPGAYYPDPNAMGPSIKSFYYQNAQYLPATLSVDARIDLQNKLIAAGLLSKYVPGQWDENSAAGLEYVMGLANQAGVDYETMLDRIVASGGLKKVDSSGGGGLGGPAPLSDEDVRAIANKTAQSVIGRNLRDDELGSFMPAFRQMYAGGTSYSTAGEAVVRQQVAPVESVGYGIGNAMQVIDSMLSSGTGGAG